MEDEGHSMKFNKAIYIYNGKKELLNVNEIEKRADFKRVTNNIFCPGKKCGAKLIFKKLRTGKYYLSKHPAYQHGEYCEFSGKTRLKRRNLKNYIEMNGNISSRGINRRKNEGLAVLDDFLHPEVKRNVKQAKIKTTTVLAKPDNSISEKPIIKVNYDPNAGLIKEQITNKNSKVKEPPFFWRLPAQITNKDSNKNLKTGVKIKRIIVNSTGNGCEIFGELQGVDILFKLPEAFFYGSSRQTSTDQLVKFLKILAVFVESTPTEIYLVTMCQAQVIDEKNIVLYILDPEFLAFLTKDEKKYSSLTKIAVAISSRMLK